MPHVDAAHLRRWARSPKGLFAGILLLLTVPAAQQAGWALVLPPLGAAIGACMLLDLPLLRWRDGAWGVPDGALLTGWLVGVVLSPYVGWRVAAATGALAIVAKHLLRVKRANVLNPAAAGLVASALAFDTGQNWWGALPALPLPYLGLVLATAVFMSRRLNKLPLVLAFLGVHFALATLAAYLGDPARVAELFRAPDLHMALFFAGFMATDPPTSPTRPREQLQYGAIAAVSGLLLYVGVGAVYFLLGGLLVANLWEGWRKWRRYCRTGMVPSALVSR
jgi:Na+-translocating ferredoxin:NAD+ oxidoreductase RnfD subunit